MATKKEDKAPTTEIKSEILELAEKLQKDITVDKKTGAGTQSENLYEKNLPDGLTTDTVKQVKEYDSAFVAAGTHAFGQLAIAAMAKNKGLEKATIELSMGHRDTMGVSVERSKTFTNHLSGNGEQTTKYGVTSVTYDARAGATSGGQLKRVRTALAEAAAAQLKA